MANEADLPIGGADPKARIDKSLLRAPPVAGQAAAAFCCQAALQPADGASRSMVNLIDQSASGDLSMNFRLPFSN
ncbi:hypothetical protein [Bradyrhizobium sp. RDM4]|uniref:hypothetical protein n=1 Tax=Bradyrhizobium sp. RDM4 TaxID=3378765 RepID=UPI0038FC3725